MEGFVPRLRIEDYKKAYEMVFGISYDVEEFTNGESPTADELEKFKWIIAIVDILSDVPLGYAQYAVRKKSLFMIKTDSLKTITQRANKTTGTTS